MIGLLSFIYLSVHIALLAAETNVVATRRLWPRSLPLANGGPTTDGDRSALELREAAVGGESPASAVAFPQPVSAGGARRTGERDETGPR